MRYTAFKRFFQIRLAPLYLGSMDISVRLCEAGATNDVETLATFQRNGANFKTSNYGQRTAGRCRLTLSKPELKTRLVSALTPEM
jgi:hypothetical protein